VAKIADFGEGGEFADSPESAASDLFAIVTPMVRAVTNNQVTGWGALIRHDSPGQSEIDSFVRQLKQYGTEVLAWKQDANNPAKKEPALRALEQLRQHAWLRE
jgi:hypothetical protein